LAMPILFSSLVWHLAGICFVQVGRLAGVVAAYTAFFVTALTQMMLYGW